MTGAGWLVGRWVVLLAGWLRNFESGILDEITLAGDLKCQEAGWKLAGHFAPEQGRIRLRMRTLNGAGTRYEFNSLTADGEQRKPVSSMLDLLYENMSLPLIWNFSFVIILREQNDTCSAGPWWGRTIYGNNQSYNSIHFASDERSVARIRSWRFNYTSKDDQRVIEWFSVECRKTKAKVVTLTNPNRRKQLHCS